MLSAIVAVTLLVPDVDAAAEAYQATLSYEAVERGRVPPEQAALWGAERLEGREFVVLRPESGEPVYLRFVETDAEAAPAMRALGWNATEILVEDPVALEARMADAPFRVIGPPAPLEFNPKVVAMQALGPAGELLYFTHMPPGASKFGLGSATTFVDRVFIVVLGVHDIRRTLDYYGGTFGLPVTEPAPSRIDVLADAWALPRSQPFLLGIARLPERFLIEVDEYPAAASVKRVADGELPAGMAMVSFTVPSLEPHLAQFVSPPVTLNGVPYDGRRAGVLRGPDGEHIELVEAKAVEAGPASGGRR